MEPIRNLKELEKLVKEKETPTMSVAFAQDEDTIQAVERAVKEKIVKAILVGDKNKIIEICQKLNISPALFEIVDEPNEKKSGDVAVKLIVDKKANLLMKGLIATPYFLKSILNKEFDLIPKGALLSHTSLIDVPTYDKLLIVSDVAMIPEPTLDDKIQMINYNIAIAAKLGITNPKVALVTANEKVTDKMPSTIDAAVISKMADRKQIKGAVIDGPLALDVAISKKACEIKGLKSPVDGYADILIFANIEAGNVFFKTITMLANGVLAGVVTGAPFPAVLVSRADSEDSKYYSIVLGAALA
ncbi:MAG: phosphate acyltransferase [Acidobacteria bacterium]|jgi:phosphate butyryltransferase|nr:phosphate acyltransferase [Acidobacteriota bacterium]